MGQHTPSSGFLLVGTCASVASLVRQLAATGDTRPIVGCLIVDGGQRPLPGVRVLGRLDDLQSVTQNYDVECALITVPAELAAAASRAHALFAALAIPTRTVPCLDDLLDGRASPVTPTVRIDPSSLIGRPPRLIDRALITRLITDRRVLVTGAGGSIGSELVRIVSTFQPSELILMERSENALFEIDRAMSRLAPHVPRRAIMHDVVDAAQTRRTFLSLRPDVVFHAAAHKHVPLMEDHPAHAVSNNVAGTKSVTDAAIACGAARMVLISTDKAVRPSSVMGATKRLAEMYARAAHAETVRTGGSTRVTVVRFGNVLGSACSVLPIWLAQLADGGPLTITDPRMTRYFMTIREAASLVLQSCAMQRDAETDAPIAVLDMGDPVRILDLARRLVELHGYRAVVGPDGTPTDTRPAIAIDITGARPGEKLHEELAYASENLEPTEHPAVHRWAGGGIDGVSHCSAREINELIARVRIGMRKEDVVAMISKLVPLAGAVDAGATESAEARSAA